jgi:transposase
MGRAGEPVLAVSAEQRAAVEATLRQRDLAPRLRERLEMVKGAALGQDEATIAAWVGRTPRTVRRWLGRFAAGGVTALADAPRPGRPPEADPAYLAALAAVVDTEPRARAALRRLDLAAAERVSRRADRGAPGPRLAARHPRPAALRLRAPQRHTRPPAGPGGGRRLRGRTRGGGGKPVAAEGASGRDRELRPARFEVGQVAPPVQSKAAHLGLPRLRGA